MKVENHTTRALSTENCKRSGRASAQVAVALASNPSHCFDLTVSGGSDQKFEGSCERSTSLKHSKNSNSALRLCDDCNVASFNGRMEKSFEGQNPLKNKVLRRMLVVLW